MQEVNSLKTVSASVDFAVPYLEKPPNFEREWEFCAKITLDTGNCLELLADTPTRLPADKITLLDDHLERDHKTSPTNIGLYLASLVAMRDLNIMTAGQSAMTIDAVLTTLDSLERYEGLYYNWYDTETGETYAPYKSRIVSTVDNAWLAVGLMTIKNAGLGNVSEHAGALFDAIDLSKLVDPKTELFYGHFNTSEGAFSAYHNDVLLSETRIASYLGLSRNILPYNHFLTLGRHAPVGRPETSPSEKDFIKSWGGSMFEALMPTLFVDEGFSVDLNLAHHAQVRAQLAYGDANFGGHWGVSVCLTPSDGYQELGVHYNAMSGYYRESSVITPHAKLLALPFAREAALSGLMKDLTEYPGCYTDRLGFSDSIDTSNGEVSDTFLALNQAMIFLALFNDWHKDSGGIRRYTSPELTSWRSRSNQDLGTVAVQYSYVA